VKNLAFDPEKKSVQISVDEDQLSLAIGKKGQNARLTSRLTGWEINIDKDTSATTAVEQKGGASSADPCRRSADYPEQALALVKSGFTNLEGLRDADVQDLVDILAVDDCSQSGSPGEGKTSKAKDKGGCRAGGQAGHPSTLKIRSGYRSPFDSRSRECFADRSKKTN
jgi:hypothetical protein